MRRSLTLPALAVAVALLGGLVEFVALARSRWATRRQQLTR